MTQLNDLIQETKVQIPHPITGVPMPVQTVLPIRQANGTISSVKVTNATPATQGYVSSKLSAINTEREQNGLVQS